MTVVVLRTLRRVATAAVFALVQAPALAQPPVPPQPPPGQPPPGQTSPAPPVPGQPTPPAGEPAVQPGTPVPAVPPIPPPPPTWIVSTDAAAFFIYVKPDRAKGFEEMLARLKKGIAASKDDELMARTKGWAVFSLPDPGPAGTRVYVSLVSPATTAADYSFSALAAATLPADVDELWGLWREAATTVTKLSLTALVPKPAAPPVPPPAVPPND